LPKQSPVKTPRAQRFLQYPSLESLFPSQRGPNGAQSGMIGATKPRIPLRFMRTTYLRHPVHGKNFLGEIDNNGDNTHDFSPSDGLDEMTPPILAFLMPLAATSLRPRDGEVKFIH
jgi:hypothetical protein